MVFVMGGVDALKNGASKELTQQPLSDYWNNDVNSNGTPSGTGRDYKNYVNNTQTIEGDFDIEKYNYVSAFLIALCLILFMLVTIFTLVSRLFEIAVLYVVSPMFVCTMPMDDGRMFEKWRDMFVSKMFVVLGPVAVMQLFMMVTPTIVGGSIVFNSQDSSMDMIIKMLIIIGGVYAVNVSPYTILKIINPEAAYMAEGNSSMISSMIMSKVR
jgi:hypothetical protein